MDILYIPMNIPIVIWRSYLGINYLFSAMTSSIVSIKKDWCWCFIRNPQICVTDWLANFWHTFLHEGWITAETNFSIVAQPILCFLYLATHIQSITVGNINVLHNISPFFFTRLILEFQSKYFLNLLFYEIMLTNITMSSSITWLKLIIKWIPNA